MTKMQKFDLSSVEAETGTPAADRLISGAPQFRTWNLEEAEGGLYAGPASSVGDSADLRLSRGRPERLLAWGKEGSGSGSPGTLGGGGGSGGLGGPGGDGGGDLVGGSAGADGANGIGHPPYTLLQTIAFTSAAPSNAPSCAAT